MGVPLYGRRRKGNRECGDSPRNAEQAGGMAAAHARPVGREQLAPPIPGFVSGPDGRGRARASGRRSLTVLLAVAAATAVSGCGAGGGEDRSAPVPHTPATAQARRAPGVTHTKGASDGRNAFRHPRSQAPARLPDLGPGTLARVPRDAAQVLVATGEGRNSPRSRVVLYEHTVTGWQATAHWAAHNALKGWTADHHSGDLRSPAGVFTLSAAGGRLSDPGTKLPYDHSPGGFGVGGTGFSGEPLAGSFDYVVAIDYNRKTGTSPLDWTRPLGPSRGGGIWLHVDHGGPTHGCVSLTEPHMKQLLRTLDPARHPVIVMGDRSFLRR